MYRRTHLEVHTDGWTAVSPENLKCSHVTVGGCSSASVLIRVGGFRVQGGTVTKCVNLGMSITV